MKSIVLLVVLLLLPATAVHANENWGVYEWNENLSVFVKIESGYDPNVQVPVDGGIELYPAGSEMGCWLNPNPVVCNGLAAALAAKQPGAPEALNSIDTLDPVLVTADRPASPWVFVVNPFGGGSVGGGGRLIGVYALSNASIDTGPARADNPTKATCGSDEMTRSISAAYEFGNWRAGLNMQLVQTGRGQTVTVTYSDGSTEDHVWLRGRIPSNLSPPETYLARVPGTLRRPQG